MPDYDKLAGYSPDQAQAQESNQPVDYDKLAGYSDPITSGQPQQGYVSNIDYYKDRDPKEWQQNIGKDVNQMVGSIGALGSIPFARVAENAYAASKGKPLPGLIYPHDAEQLGGAIKGAMWDYPMNEYVMPAMHDTPEQYGQYLMQQFGKAPLQHTMDVLPFVTGGAGLAGKAIGGVSKLAGVGKVASTVAKVADAAADVADVAAPVAKTGWIKDLSDLFHNQVVPSLKEALTPGSAEQQEIADKLGQLDQDRLDKIMQAHSELNSKWNNLSHEQKVASTSVGDYSDRALRKQYGSDPHMQDFLGSARKFNKVTENLVPQDVAMVHSYGPMYLRHMEEARIRAGAPGEPLSFGDLTQPQHMKAISKMKARMDKLAIQPPVFSALRSSAQIQQILGQINDKLGGLKGKTAFSAHLAGSEGIEKVWQSATKNLPGWLRPRSAARIRNMDTDHGPMWTLRNPNHSLNMEALTVTEMAKTYQFQAIMDFVKWLKDRYGSVDKEHTLNLRGYVKDVAKRQGYSEAQVDKFFDKIGGDTITLPKNAAKLVEEALNGRQEWPAFFQMIERFNGKAKYARFALDPTFGPRLALQTEILNLWSLKTPADALNYVTGHILARHPNINEVLPPGMIGSHGTGIHFEKLVASANRFEEAIKAPGQAVRAWSDYWYGIHNEQRQALAVKYILTSLKGARPDALKTMTALFDQATALKELKKWTYQNNLNPLRDYIKGYQGFYDVASRRNFMNRVGNMGYLTWDWVRHAWNIAKTLPTQHPIKLAVINSIARTAGQLLQADVPEDLQRMGYLPMHDAQGKQVTYDGKNKYVSGWSLDSLEAGFHMLKMASHWMFQGSGEVDIPSSPAPITQTLMEMLMETDYNTKKKFLDENSLVGHRRSRLTGRQEYYDKETMQVLTPDDLKPGSKYTKPEMLTRFFRNSFGKQINPLLNLQASPDLKHGQIGIASPMTSVFKPQAYGNRQGPLTEEPFDFWSNMVGVRTRNK